MRQRFGTPPVTLYLIIIDVLLWLPMLASQGEQFILGNFALFPVGSPFFEPWQVVSYMFLHGSWTHIIFNMFTLWMFGRFIEYDLGSKRFLLYYMVCGVGAGLIQLLVGYFTGAPMNVPTVGASGAIYGILLAFGMLHPNDIIMPLIPPIPMKAKWAVLIFGAIELFAGIASSFNTVDNVAHFAHLGGMLWGFLLLLYWRKRRVIY